jgi:hypothetical protein
MRERVARIAQYWANQGYNAWIKESGWPDDSSPCVAFGSWVTHAAGIPYQGIPHPLFLERGWFTDPSFGWWANAGGGNSYSYERVERSYEYWTGPGGGQAVSESDFWQLRPGDRIQTGVTVIHQDGTPYLDWDHEVTVVDNVNGIPYVASMGTPTDGYIPYNNQGREIDSYRGMQMPFDKWIREHPELWSH